LFIKGVANKVRPTCYWQACMPSTGGHEKLPHRMNAGEAGWLLVVKGSIVSLTKALVNFGHKNWSIVSQTFTID
jgi:hypothetical protein